MTTLYSLRTAPSGDGFVITKFDRDHIPESSYPIRHATPSGFICECPAGQKPICRHRTMLPFFIKSNHINDGWFFDWDTRQWRKPLGEVAGIADDRMMGRAEPPAFEPNAVANAAQVILDHEREVMSNLTGPEQTVRPVSGPNITQAVSDPVASNSSNGSTSQPIHSPNAVEAVRPADPPASAAPAVKAVEPSRVPAPPSAGAAPIPGAIKRRKLKS